MQVNKFHTKNWKQNKKKWQRDFYEWIETWIFIRYVSFLNVWFQDEFAVASQNKAEAAQAAGMFKEEIVPVIVPGRKGDVTFASGMKYTIVVCNTLSI